MKKNILAVISIAVMALVLVGCSEKPKPVEDGGGKETVLVKIHEDIKEHLGDSYVSTMAMDEAQLQELIGLDTDNLVTYIAEMPMMSTHADTYISVLAKEGKGEAVEAELTAYRDELVKISMQYPGNIAKVNSAQVVRHGDYVFFVLLGNFDERTDVTEAQEIQFAQDEVKAITDIIAKNFQ